MPPPSQYYSFTVATMFKTLTLVSLLSLVAPLILFAMRHL